MPTDGGMDKEDEVRSICGGILLSREKGWSDAVCSYVDGRRDNHTKKETGEPHMISLRGGL